MRSRPQLERLEGRIVLSTFQVNTTLDTVAVNLQNGTDAQGHVSLRSALMASNALPGADTILLPSGTFRLTIAGTGEDAAARGDLDIKSDVTIQGRGHTATIIDGNALDRVFHVLSGTAAIAQLTIQGGRSNTGAGLLNSGGHVTLAGDVVQNNLAIGADGANGVDGVTGVSQATDGHNGGEADGGGIFNASGSLTLVDSTVTLNRALGGKGGHGGSGTIVIGAFGVTSGIPGASDGRDGVGGTGGLGGRGGLAQGGGVVNAPGASLTLSGTTIANNSAVGGSGGDGGDGGDGMGGNGAPSIAPSDIAGMGGHGFGGAGGAGGAAGLGLGGGVMNAGPLTLNGSPNAFLSNQVLGGKGGGGGFGGGGFGGAGGNDFRTLPDGDFGGVGGPGGFGLGGHSGTSAPGASGLGGGIDNAPGAVLTNVGPVTFASNQATGGHGGEAGQGGQGFGGAGGEGGIGSLGGAGGFGTAGGSGGLGGTGQGGGLFNATGAQASFTGDPLNLTRETVALFQANLATGGAGGPGGDGGASQGGFGGDAFGTQSFSGGGPGGLAMGGDAGSGGGGGLAEGGGFLNAGNLAFTAISVNANTNQALGGAGGTGGRGGDAQGGSGGGGVHGGAGGGAASGAGGNGGNGGSGLGGGGFNTPSGVLLIAPRQGAVAGSAQALGRSLIRSNNALGGLPGSFGNPGAPTPGHGSPTGTVTVAAPGVPGVLGPGIGGGLDLATHGSVTLRNTTVTLNQATTSDPDISGTFLP